MAQGNPFGPRGGPWMPAARLRALAAAGASHAEIAQANEAAEGWRPSRAAVKRKLDALGMAPRRLSHGDLLPWRIAPEHNSSMVRHMLQAEGRARQGKQLSDTDRKLRRLLRQRLAGDGTPQVVTYDPAAGFAFVPREDSDTNIVRATPNRRAGI
jgi:hypothetical protein